MKIAFKFILFLLINFAALGIGTLLMNSGPTSEWYLNLNKAPWTPPGWLFGVAWTTIMVCFSVYMVALIRNGISAIIWVLFGVQWVLNATWNWFFFNQHFMILAELVLLGLTLIVGGFLFQNHKTMKYRSIFILPYFLWLLVANSLNIYAIINN